VTHWRPLAAFAAIFVFALVAGAFLADAVGGQNTTAAPGPQMQAGADAPIAVMAPIWVEANPPSDVNASVPEEVRGRADPVSSGVLVVQPTDETATPRPAGESGPIEVAEIDAIAQQARDEAADDPAMPEPGAGVPTSLDLSMNRDPSRLRFVDPCADAPNGTCPFGVAARVALALEDVDLQIAGFGFRGGMATDGIEISDRCPAGFVAGDFNIGFSSTSPVTIWFSYGNADTTREFQEQMVPASLPGEPEYERWVANVEADRIDGIHVLTSVRSCAVLDVEPGTFYTFASTFGRTADGRVVETTWMPVIDTRPLEGSLGRPPTSIVVRGGTDASVTLWQRDPDEHYRTVAWPIDNSQPDAPSCTDIEGELFIRDLWGIRHHDLGYAVFPIIPSVETPPPRVYDPQWGWRQRFDLSLREGRPYTLCTWEAHLGDGPFDEWEILEREQIEITTPNRHPITMSLVEVDVGDAPTAHSVSLSVPSGDFCDTRSALSASVTTDRAGPIPVDRTFCETRGVRPDSTAFAALSIDGTLADTLAIPLDASRGCERDGSAAACSTPLSEYFEATTEIPGSCETQCASVNTLVRVDYLPSNGRGTDRWLAAAPGTFEGSSVLEEDRGPAVDEFSSDLSPIPDRVDALLAYFEFSRPARYEIRLYSSSDDESCNPVVSGTGDGRTDIVIDGLCADTFYGLSDITLTDENGLTNRQPLGMGDLTAWTNGYASYLDVALRLHSVEDETAAIEHCRLLGEEYREHSSTGQVSDRCWEHLSVSPTSQFYLGNTLARPGGSGFCFRNPLSAYLEFAPPREDRPSLDAVHGADVPYRLHAVLELDPGCGADLSTNMVAYLFDEEFTIPLERLDDLGWSIFVEQDGLLWEFDFTRIDRGVGSRSHR